MSRQVQRTERDVREKSEDEPYNKDRYRALVPIIKIHEDFPSKPIGLERLGQPTFCQLVIVFEDGNSLHAYREPFSVDFYPTFVFHVRSVPYRENGLQPVVRPGYCCWVKVRDGLENRTVRMFVGRVLLKDEPHTLFAVYRYDSPVERNSRMAEAGILVVPSKNTSVPESGVWSGEVDSQEYMEWEFSLKEEEHHEAQLLFQEGDNGGNVGADWTHGARRFGRDLALMDEREKFKRERDSMVKEEWKQFVA